MSEMLIQFVVLLSELYEMTEKLRSGRFMPASVHRRLGMHLRALHIKIPLSWAVAGIRKPASLRN